MISDLQIDNIIVSNLQPTKKDFFNKSDKLSAQGYVGLQKVKIYETFDKRQGKLRKFVDENVKLGKYFPKLIACNEKYIVEEWIKGITLKDKFSKKIIENKSKDNSSQWYNIVKELKEFITTMWETPYETEVFDYIKHIHDRINKPMSVDYQKIPIKLNHNDLSLENILITDKGVKIIDNEFLGCSSGWILNLKNSFIEDDFNYGELVSTNTLNNLWKIRKEL